MATHFPCSADLAFYQSKRTPAWAARIKSPAVASIDHCVNSHAGQHRPSSGQVAAGNLLAILAGYRRRGQDLESELLRIALHPGCAISPEKRAAFARKWALRLARLGP
jgi:hypothetical protein